MTHARALVLLALAASWSWCLSPDARGADEHPLAPKNLRCEYLVDPLGLDETKPRLSWQVDDPRRGAVQATYRIIVSQDELALAQEKGAAWDSGKVASSETHQIGYAGANLEAFHRYFWRVRTWDAAGEASPWSATASWSMGPLALSDWKAAWIGDATPAPAWTPARNGYHSQFSDKEDDYKWVQIDFGEERIFNGFRFWPARPYDHADAPGFLFPKQFKIWVSGDPKFVQTLQKLVDYTWRDLPNPGTQPWEQKLEGSRMKMRYVRLGIMKLGSADGRYGCALSEFQVTFEGADVSRGARVTGSDSIETGEWSLQNLTDGDVESHGPTAMEPLPAPMLRRSFVLEPGVKRAFVYASALGAYELHVNGRRAGDRALAPEWTKYNGRVQYQAYDVTDLLQRGENVLGVQLGDGWYAGKLGLSGLGPDKKPRGIYGRKPIALVQLEVELDDGSKVVIGSDESWKCTTAGPVRSSDLLDGETYDARAEMLGWDARGFDDRAWKPAAVAGDVAEGIFAQRNEPIRVTQEVKPIALSEPKPGVFVFDMGQNMVGWCRMKVKGAAGATVTLRHGEMLNDDGTLYTANLRGAKATDTFILRGAGEETFEPHFTYHGFRYVEVTGLAQKPELGDLVGRVVHSSASEVGTFECSDPMLNKLWQNILWTQRGNMMSVPTDCPQRDERLGWMGDIAVFAQTACFEMDMAAFFGKWVQDVRDAQARDGRYPDFAPHPYGPDERFSGTPAWGDAGTIVPWCAYVNYGDRRLLEKHFESARRWVDWIRAKNPDYLWTMDRGSDYGDWLSGDTIVHEGWPKSGAEAPKEVLATAFYAHSADLVSRMAAALGRANDAEQYRNVFELIQKTFNAAYVDAQGKVKGDTQGGYALALAFDLLPMEKRDAAASHMLDALHAYQGGQLSTGFQTTHLAMLELSRRGHHDVALSRALSHEFPSWGYAIDNGATTMWERRDAFVKERGLQDAGMNSFNHYAFGAVGEWMMRCVAGIEPDEEHPGWSHFFIHPRPPGQLTRARGEHRSIRGKIASAWSVEGSKYTLDVTVPANTSATVFVPARNASTVTEGGRVVKEAAGVHFVREEDGCAVFEVAAGSYHFSSEYKSK